MKRRRKLKRWVVNVIIVLIVIGICSTIYYSYKVFSWKKSVDDNQKIQEEIEKSIIVIDDDTEEEPEYQIDFEKIKEQNSDTIAYIKVNETNIDYVVVKGNNNSYYLNHNFNKEYNIAGWIFADYKNKFDGSDKNMIIYGHNTRDGSMFGTLKNILEKNWYENKENHILLLVTEKGKYTYQVFSTYSIIPEDYYINTEFNTDIEFEEFLREIKSRSIYDYGVDVSQDDKILTLSSCISNGKKRVVLHAKLIES